MIALDGIVGAFLFPKIGAFGVLLLRLFNPIGEAGQIFLGGIPFHMRGDAPEQLGFFYDTDGFRQMPRRCSPRLADAQADMLLSGDDCFAKAGFFGWFHARRSRFLAEMRTALLTLKLRANTAFMKQGLQDGPSNA